MHLSSKVDPIVPNLHTAPFNEPLEPRKLPGRLFIVREVYRHSIAVRVGFREVYVKEGPKAFAKAVREHRKTKGMLLMDTTWCALVTRLSTEMSG
jgi:pyruvate carboxylase